jgi:hypothetical protein
LFSPVKSDLGLTVKFLTELLLETLKEICKTQEFRLLLKGNTQAFEGMKPMIQRSPRRATLEVLEAARQARRVRCSPPRPRTNGLHNTGHNNGRNAGRASVVQFVPAPHLN